MLLPVVSGTVPALLDSLDNINIPPLSQILRDVCCLNQGIVSSQSKLGSAKHQHTIHNLTLTPQINFATHTVISAVRVIRSVAEDIRPRHIIGDGVLISVFVDALA